jgi:hypothetical protein
MAVLRTGTQCSHTPLYAPLSCRRDALPFTTIYRTNQNHLLNGGDYGAKRRRPIFLFEFMVFIPFVPRRALKYRTD